MTNRYFPSSPTLPLASVFSLALVLAAANPATAQTVTVAKTGGTFSTVQAAISSFATDVDPTPNVVQITDSELYDEVVTINVPLTLEGTALTRPRLALQANPAAAVGGTDGLVLALPSTISTGTIALKNLILIPSRTVVPGGTGRGLRTASPNMFVYMSNVLITSNNGSDQPVSVDGLSLADLSGATMFGDDGMFIGSANTLPEGAGVEFLFSDVVITHNKGQTGADGIVISNVGTSVFRKYRFEDGCVISYNQRAGCQLNGDVIVDAPNRPMIITGHSTNGYWLVSAGAAERSVNGLIVHDNGGRGFWLPVGGGVGAAVNFSIKNTILSNNGVFNLDFSTSGGPSPNVLLEEVTIANQKAGAGAINIASAFESNIIIRNSIIAGNGSASGNAILNNGVGSLTLEGTAVVTAGTYALVDPPFTGTGTVTGAPTTAVDPDFAETANFTSPAFFDVRETDYATANATGGPLSGGADYTPTSAVNTWSIY